MNDVQVSVIIPCYNSERTVLKAINSVLDGSLLPYEILIYDDNSNDSTIKIIENNFCNNNLIKILKGTENKGAGNARSELIKKAGGNFIAFLDADDFWYEYKLETQIKQITRSKCDIVTSGYDIFDESGILVGTRIPIKIINKYTMHLTNWLPTSMTVFRKNLQAAEEMPLIRKRQDYGFWLRIFKKNRAIKCCVIDKPLGGYLRRSNGLSSNKLNNILFNFRIFREILNYSIFSSIFFVSLNAAIRVLRK